MLDYEDLKPCLEKARFLIELKHKELFAKYDSEEEIEYYLECFRIDIIEKEIIENFCTTAYIIEAINFSYTEYERLSDKYYNLCLEKLEYEKKDNITIEKFKKEQKDWLEAMNSYRKFISDLSVYRFDIGEYGTMHTYLDSNKILSAVKDRVKRLYEYYFEIANNL